MKKLVVLPALLAVSLGVAACAKHDDAANTALANDTTLNSDEVLTDENAAAFDANAADPAAADLNASNPALGNAGDEPGDNATAVGNGL